MKIKNEEYDVTVYCDGSAHENYGGWGAIYIGRYREREVFAGGYGFTSQAAEIMAAIWGLQYLTRDGVSVKVYTDSQYVVRCFTEGWLPRWRRKGWRGPSGGERPNRALWETLEGIVALHDVDFEHVRGHAGNVYNERAHMLATAGRHRFRQNDLKVHSERAASDYRASREPRSRKGGGDNGRVARSRPRTRRG